EPNAAVLDAARIRRLEPAEQPKQRRFPRAAAAHDYDKFSAFCREINVVEHDRASIRFAHLFEPYPTVENCLAFHDDRCYVVSRGLPTVIRDDALLADGAEDRRTMLQASEGRRFQERLNAVRRGS